jgi:2-dehydro-3-deoxygluconokinase
MTYGFRFLQDRNLDLIGVGEGMVELWADTPLSEAETLRQRFGGDVLNTLVLLARLNRSVGFVSKVGDDPFGAGLLSKWQEEGIDTRNCPLVEGINGIYFISVDRNGEREFSYRREGSAASSLSLADIDASYLCGAKVILLSGITQALSESAQAATVGAARLARENGVVVAFDPNYRPALWRQRAAYQGLPQDGGLQLAQKAVQELLPYVDILLPSFPADRALWPQEAELIDDLIEALRQLGPPLIGIKSGSTGAHIVEGNMRRHVAEIAVEKVVDSTGAGDTWNAAFLHGLLCGGNASEAASYANRLAAWKLAYRGAIPPRQVRIPVNPQ